MYLKSAILIVCVAAQVRTQEINNSTFPPGFLFGAATAAFQIEGGWDADGKGENIWDHATHTIPNFVVNNETADIACDSYHKYKDDVAIMKDLNLSHYRFSLSWSRILPEGTPNNISQAGISYYTDLIKELKLNGIEPYITLYHWDLPQPLQDLGGWVNDLSIQWFEDYARVAFENFGQEVKHWMTFNEIHAICAYGYGQPYLAPAVSAPGVGEYLCAHNILRAHARAWHLYDEEFRADQAGSVGIVIDSSWFEPATNTTADEEAAEIKLQFVFGWYAHPIIFGDYPEVMKSKIAERSTLQGYPRSRLPQFTEEEIAYVQGTIDFLGVNTYTSSLVAAMNETDLSARSYDDDSEVSVYQPDSWQPTASSAVKVTPWGTRKLLKWIKENYNNPNILITENGYCDSDGTLEDDVRVNYLRDYLSNIKDAMDIDGVNVTGYTYWSLMDNFEWISGYHIKYGLYYIDFEDPDRTRVAKKSATYYKKIIATRCLVDECDVV